MRLKQLAESSGTSAATIKFYLREGIVPAGRAVNATLAEYDDRHLRRLQAGLVESIESSDVHLEMVRALKEINSLLATVAYPILSEHGLLRDTTVDLGGDDDRVRRDGKRVLVDRGAYVSDGDFRG